jgi:hypothetical protein
MSWKPEVYVKPDGWVRNGLVFATKEEVEANANDLLDRWLLVLDCRAVEVPDAEFPVNHKWDIEKHELTGVEK